MQSETHPLKGWIPFRLITAPAPLVQWLYVYDQPFSDPFFDDTTSHCRSHEYNSSRYRCMSSIESLIEWASQLPEINPDAFIFHVSRCGSTLISQLIGLDPAYTTLSEVPFFDEVLRMHYKTSIDAAQQEQLFKAAVTLIGTRRNDTQKKLFIKTDSWHIFYRQLFRRLYPDAAFILLYRSPDEVARSHAKLKGMHAVFGPIEPGLFGFTEKEIESFTYDNYIAFVLEKYFSEFEKTHKQEPSLLLDYRQGVLPMIEQTGAHLNIRWTEEHLQQMTERSKFHSKNPEQNFNEEAVTEAIPEYLTKAASLYRQLEERRLAELQEK